MAGSAEEIVYVVDASSWISVDGNPDANRILLHLDILIQRGKVKCPPEVWNEIRSAYMVGWLKGKRKDIVHSLRSNIGFLKKVGEVTIKYPAMAGARGVSAGARPTCRPLLAGSRPNSATSLYTPSPTPTFRRLSRLAGSIA
jgi:hypothetical protein